MESDRQLSNSSSDVSTQPIKIYEKTYYLPVLNSPGFTQLQQKIKARQQLIRANQRQIKQKTSERVFFWIKTEKEITVNREITFEEKFQELERLVKDYNGIISFLSQHKTSYERFFLELTEELKGIVYKRCQDLVNVEQKRSAGEAKAKGDPVLVNVYQEQKQQIFKNAFILHRVTQLMLKKIQLINNSIQKLASDQVEQRQLLEGMVSKLRSYQEAYELQKEINKIEQDLQKLAEVAKNFEKIMSPVLDPFQGLIDQVVSIDQDLSATVEEIGVLVEDLFKTDVRRTSWDKQGNLGDELLEFLCLGYQKKEYIKDGLDTAYWQTIDSLEQLSLPPDVLEETSLTITLRSIETNVDAQLNQLSGQYKIVEDRGAQKPELRESLEITNRQNHPANRQQLTIDTTTTKSPEYLTLDLGNGVTIEFASIPAGRFLMGSPDGEEGRYDNEGPQHWVDVPAFWMGKYPVTQAQWQAVMGNNPAFFKGNNRPVECVSWHDCVKFCEQASQKLGKKVTMPSEAQWEYACRAGTTTPFHFGETITTDLANYNGNYTYAKGPKGIYRKETTEVGTFPPNAFGLYDMHGNVWEWCLDNYHDSYSGAPTDGSAWGNKNYICYVLRGGSWVSLPKCCRSA